MKTLYAVLLCVLLLLVSACAQKLNDPADVQAIKKSMDDYVKAANAGDADAVAALLADNSVHAAPNMPAIVGKEATKSAYKDLYSKFKSELSAPVEDVVVAGNRAAARGTWSRRLTPKEQGTGPLSDSGSWSVFFSRQNDGSWKWDWVGHYSNQPLPGTTASGEDEKALLQMERDMTEALIKQDAAALDKMLATEFQANYVGLVGSKKQFLAAVKSGTTKWESAVNSEMKAIVIGDRAIVNGLSTEKSSNAGKDTSGQYRWTDVFVKRDGRWQAVTGYASKVQ